MSRINMLQLRVLETELFFIERIYMHNIFELKELTQKPKINDISLILLQEYYNFYLYPFIYKYKLEFADNHVENIELRFDKENFCHLLGIESIAKYHVPFAQLKKYKGIDGWNNVSNLSIDFNTLKSLNRKKFNDVKAKFVYFYLLPQIIDSPMIVDFDNSKVNPPSSIQCKLLFYSRESNAIIHLGIDKKDDEDYYIPRTFFVEKLTCVNSYTDIYVNNQIKVNLISKQNIITL